MVSRQNILAGMSDGLVALWAVQQLVYSLRGPEQAALHAFGLPELRIAM